MTVINAVGNALTGATGSGKFAGETSAVLVTPTIGAATATTITFSPTTGGIVGTTTNNNTNAGNVGELISSVISSGAPVTFSAGVDKDLTSISVTAGDWDIYGNINCAGTTVTQGTVWISATSATIPDRSLYNIDIPNNALSTQCGLAAPYFRASLAGTTIIYLSGRMNGTGTLTCAGGIYARRVR